LGTYPIFIFTPHPVDQLSDDFLQSSMIHLVLTLYQHMPRQRVFSVFAPEPVAKAFACIWSIYTGIAIEKTPYYYAAISHCSKMTPMDREVPPFHESRLAVRADIPAAAELCYGFASEAVGLGSQAALAPNALTISPPGAIYPVSGAFRGGSRASHPTSPTLGPCREQ
jgi:hypothetical protein